jgi:hypothetical protein
MIFLPLAICQTFYNATSSYMSFVAALGLLDFCYQQDHDQAQQLLTCELQNWSGETCLNLAVAANHKALLAHPCSQAILGDLWMGGICTRRNTNLKVQFQRDYLQNYKLKYNSDFQGKVIMCEVYKLYYCIAAGIIDMHKINPLQSSLNDTLPVHSVLSQWQ